ncbi:DUF4493 domain-containing protein [Kriegella sp. EG-1]|nr:DUF4493 domain-containing protein [Flavobacteriaceae bacterium EG-1]
MRTKMKSFLWGFALLLFFIACEKSNNAAPITETEDIISEEPIGDVIEMGTITLNPTIKDMIQVKTGKGPTLNEVLDNIIVVIKDSDNKIVVNNNYRNLPEFIELVPNTNYRLTMQNKEMQPARYDIPLYGSDVLSEPIFFDVVSGQNMVIDVVLKLLDVVVSITFSEAIKIKYPDISVEAYLFYVSNETDYYPLSWNILDVGRLGYFHVGYNGGIEAELVVTITASNDLGVEIETEKIYNNITANQYYSISIEEAEDSLISFNVTLSDEEVINDTITFPN